MYCIKDIEFFLMKKRMDTNVHHDDNGRGVGRNGTFTFNLKGFSGEMLFRV